MTSATIRQWILQVLQENESKAMDNAADRQALAVCLEAGVERDQDQLVNQIAVWLEQRGFDELAAAVRQGTWS